MEQNKAAILVAEDSRDDQFIIIRSFRRIGVEHPVHTVEDGEVAKAYLAEEGPYSDRATYPEPTVLFMDIRMPRCDGFELLAHVKADPRWAGLPTIFLTSSNDPGHRARAEVMGASAFHVKPYSPEEFEDILRTLAGYWATASEE